MSTDYDRHGFTITTFFGGKDRGPCIQITTADETSVQLTQSQAADLYRWLGDSGWLDRPGDVPEAIGNVGVQDQTRERLLARMAGNIAAGWDLRTTDPEYVAKKALQIAELILKQIESRRS